MIANRGSGFTNQIFALIASIKFAYDKGITIIIVEKFLNDINSMSYSPISEIFDITEINIFLHKNYGIIIVDKYNIQFELLSIKYGTNDTNYMDITEFIKNKYYTNTLCIDKNCNFNNIKGDPCPGLIKNIIIKYKINNYIIEEIYNEYLKSNIEINFDCPYLFTLGLINSSHDNMFDKILKNIKYNTNFTMVSDYIIKDINKKNINTNKKINIIHLRLEEDGILHWSKINNMSYANYKTYLEKKYINIIQKYISNTDDNIILSSSLSNGVVDFFNKNNYNYRFIDKCFNERERNAIIDLLVSKCCNNIFIGNFNIKNLNGSVFSYYIWKYMSDTVTKIYIDLDNIYHSIAILFILFLSINLL